MSDQVLFEITQELELQDLLRFVSVCSSLRSLCFDNKVWQRHFAHGELEGEQMTSVHDYVALATRCIRAKQETEKFLYKFWVAHPQSSYFYRCNLEYKPVDKILDVMSLGGDMGKITRLSFSVMGEKRVYCIAEEVGGRVYHREHLNEEQTRLLFYKLRLYDAVYPSFYEQVEIGYQYRRSEVLRKCIIGAYAKFDEGDESWYSDSDEYTCASCGESIPEGEEEMSYHSKAILCPSCLERKLSKWAKRFVKEFIVSNKEYIFVDKSDRERAFLYQEAERQKVKFAKFTTWDQVIICAYHKTRTRTIGKKDICVQGRLEDEKSLCEYNLVRSKVRKMVLYKGQARDRMDWRKIFLEA